MSSVDSHANNGAHLIRLSGKSPDSSPVIKFVAAYIICQRGNLLDTSLGFSDLPPLPAYSLWYYSLCHVNTAAVLWEDWFCCDAITTSSGRECMLLLGFSKMIDHLDVAFFFPLSPVFIEGSIMGQQRIVKWGRMRSQRGVFKKCLVGLIAFQCALHSFSTVLSTAAHSMKVGKHRPH